MIIADIKNIEHLKVFLGRRCNIQILKEGFVFTAFLTKSPKGKSLAAMDNWMEIFGAVAHYTSEKYPIVECMHNEQDYAVIVLKPKTTNQGGDK
jgi:hypothetical protein